MTKFYQNKKILIGAAVGLLLVQLLLSEQSKVKNYPLPVRKQKSKKSFKSHTQSYKPYDFVNDKGESDSFEVQVLKRWTKNYRIINSSILQQVMKIY
jgi:L-cystine transport system substrate-binding protein